MPELGAGDSPESDESLIERVRSGDVACFSVLVQRYNRSLYRVVRSIVRNEHEAEDIVQQTHVSAFVHLHQFEGRAKFAAWLARIAAHEAFSRLRQRRHVSRLRNDGTGGMRFRPHPATPEDLLARSERVRLVEAAIDDLPLPYRAAFVLRHVEGLATSEAADWLGVSEENVRVLCHRACRLLRERMLEQIQTAADDVFSISAQRCARVTRQVLIELITRLHKSAGAA